MSAPITDHPLRRVSPDLWLCACGHAVFGARSDREAHLRHGLHIEEISKHRARIKDAQAAGRQHELGDGQDALSWGSPFRRPAGGGY